MKQKRLLGQPIALNKNMPQHQNKLLEIIKWFNNANEKEIELTGNNEKLNLYNAMCSLIRRDGVLDAEKMFDFTKKAYQQSEAFKGETEEELNTVYKDLFAFVDEFPTIEDTDWSEKNIEIVKEELNLTPQKDESPTPPITLTSQHYFVDKEAISSLYITDDYKILLPEYDEIEIKLSHLTKSIYFLFLGNEAISLKNLDYYENELLNIYKHISNQENYDKMAQSVKDVVNVDTNAIYVHLSRIKSAFYSKFEWDIADIYCISGIRNEPKRIRIPRLRIHFDKKMLNIETFNKLDKLQTTLKIKKVKRDEEKKCLR